MGVAINRILLNQSLTPSSLAVFMYTGNKDAKTVLDAAVEQYVDSKPYYEFVDDNLNNPWTRVVVSEIYESFRKEDIIINGRKFELYRSA